jgi:hypothetical protein
MSSFALSSRSSRPRTIFSMATEDRIIDICPNCHSQLHGVGNFCSVCGTPSTVHRNQAPQLQHVPPQQTDTPLPPPHHIAAHGFAQTFGLNPGVALLTVVVNTMVFVSGFGTAGIGWFTSIPIGFVLGVIVFMAQKKWYGDDNEEAFIKALIVAFLTAIPTSLPGYLTIPSGIIGVFRRRE